MHGITQGHTSSEDEEFVFLGETRSGEEEEWLGVLQLNGEETAFKLDTGVAVTAIPSSTYSSKIHGTLSSLVRYCMDQGITDWTLKDVLKGT